MIFDRNKDADKPLDKAAEESPVDNNKPQTGAEPKKKGFFSRFKRDDDNKTAAEPAPAVEPQAATADTPVLAPADGPTEKKGLFARFKRDEARPAADAPIAEPVIDTASEAASSSNASEATAAAETQPAGKPQTLFARVKRGLSRTGNNFSSGLGNLFLGQKEIDDDLFEEIETQLLMADVGLDATTEIIDTLTERVARKQLADPQALYSALKEELAKLLDAVEAPMQLPTGKKPAVILVVGVNGVGKTTTIGKLAKRLQGDGKKVVLAAGDTFRAAAVEQLQEWGARNQVPVIAQHQGADSASVIFDAVQAAQSRGTDVLIADTAGRLHNKSHLMDELSKVKRVMGKLDPSAPHEVLLVLDAGTGQNALSQAEHFIAAAGVTGIVLTKLDGTAKGGVIFALSKKFGLPVRFIGIGEGIDDLQPFVAKTFVDALFEQNQDA